MIKIADRFRPFSHKPGESCMIPCSSWAVEAYPTEIRIFGDEASFSLQLNLTGPVEGFTLEQDLEKNVVRVFGRAKEGYFSFQIVHVGKTIMISLKRGKSISYQFDGKSGVLEKDQFLEIQAEDAFIQSHLERLSLGMNKKLDWELVSRRGDLKEILPILFFLGQKAECVEVPIIIGELDIFLKRHFNHILFPKRVIDKRLGISGQDIPSQFSLAAILYKSYETIRSLFLKEENGEVLILPHLPAQFIYGRMTGLKTAKANFDLEWTKRKLRKVRIEALVSGPLAIKWPKDVDSFRIKNRPQEKGEMISRSDEIVLRPGQIYYLDKFQK